MKPSSILNFSALLFAGLLTLTTALPVAAQAELHQSYPLNPTGTVSVSNISGNIRVIGWHENRVQVDAVKRGGRGEEQEQVEIQINARPDRLEVRTLYPRNRSNHVSVDYELKVPRGAVLNSLSSTSGNISVSDAGTRVVARSTSGTVTAQGVNGDANLGTTSGNLRAEHISGALTITTASGSLQISDIGAQLNARSTSGEVRALNVRDDATVNNASGQVRLEKVGGRASVHTVSGLITVTDVSGDANLENVAEGITADGIQGRVTATSVSGRIVARNVREGVRANSVSGTIDISQSRGPLVLNTTSGAALLREVDSRDIQVATHSGAVHFAGKIYDNGRYTFDSFSSEVILTLPANSNFTLTAKTFSGSIETDFPIQLVTGSSLSGRPRRLQGTYGNSEGAQLNVGGFSSTIKLKKQ